MLGVASGDEFEALALGRVRFYSPEPGQRLMWVAVQIMTPLWGNLERLGAVL